MKRIGFIVFGVLFSLTIRAQGNQYIIQLKDKAGTPYKISQPEQFLSQRAIARRRRQNIPVVESDLPVNPVYLKGISAVGNLEIKNVSKWLNQVLIETDDATVLDKIDALPFVLSMRQSRRITHQRSIARDKWISDLKKVDATFQMKGITDLAYGFSAGQVQIHHGDFLHNNGFTGRGMLIAVIDDGFFHYQSLPAFDSIRTHNRIIDTYDFVDNKTDMNLEDAHGMYCLSTIAANVPGQMIGTAPGASFLLYRSENVASESLSEEQNWVAAAERSDSAGADVITTSLGYNEFDNPAFNHTYQDMDGKTTMIARGAEIAASKGMIVLAAAGNEGNKAWHYIITPADAKNILSVGAVNTSGVVGAFSSYGPSADGRIKPDVASVGVGTVVQGTNGTFVSGNGTSFATPNLAGLVTCLWQAFQDFTSEEIIDVVKRSSSKYATPDDRTGYGMPDFEKAYTSLLAVRTQRLNDLLSGRDILIYPNPGTDNIRIVIRSSVAGSQVLKVFDMSGRLCSVQTITTFANIPVAFQISRNGLPSGTYILRFGDGKEFGSQKVIWR